MENTPDLLSMKTYSARSAVTTERTSEKSCGSSAKSVTPPLMFLDLTMANGSTMAASWEKVTALRGESWTLNTGESPRVAVVCMLSSILRGGSAPKVLFERESLQQHFEPLEQAREASATHPAECSTGNDSLVGLGCGVRVAFDNHPQDARYTQLDKVCPTLTARYGTGGNNVPIVTEQLSSYTLQIRAGCEGGGKGALIQVEKSATLSTVQTQTLFTPTTPADKTNPCEKLPPWIVRRLTPQECAMLQGFPPDWAADVPHTDSAEYKMWGNGMALPCMLYIMEGLAAELSKEAEDGTSS